MDLGWLLPAAFGVLVTLGVSWAQIRWQDRSRKVAEQRARAEARFEEVRDYLMIASRLASTIEVGMVGALEIAGRNVEDMRRRWIVDVTGQLEELSNHRVLAAPELFLDDGEALEKLSELKHLIVEFVHGARQVRDGVSEIHGVEGKRRKVQELSGEIQARMDQLLKKM